MSVTVTDYPPSTYLNLKFIVIDRTGVCSGEAIVRFSGPGLSFSSTLCEDGTPGNGSIGLGFTGSYFTLQVNMNGGFSQDVFLYSEYL